MSAEEQYAQETEPSLDANLLKELSKKALVDALNSVNGSKTLVLDPSLAGPLGLLTEVALLKQHGVDKMYWLERGPLTSGTTNIVYLCRSRVNHAKIIADHIKRHAKESLKYNYTLLLVPRLSSLVSRLLEEEGVLGDITITAYGMQFLPIADDVLSLEYESVFKDIWVDGDETVLYDSAQALITLQKLFGLFPRLLGKGDHASRLINLLTTYLDQSRDSSIPDALSEPSSKFDSLIVLDRRVDMITPLLTQLTYEGLIDELLGIKNSHVEIPASLVNPPQNAPTDSLAALPTGTSSNSLRKENKKKYHLSSSDSLFNELRDLNFSHVGKHLNIVARRLDDDYKTSLQSKTTAQLRDFVERLRGRLYSEHQSLRIHTGISELLVPMTRTEQFNKSLEIQQNLLASYNVSEQISSIEEMIAKGADIETVVRLLCLASITSGGIKAKALENIKREFLQAYGYNFLPLLLSLAAPSLAILMPNPLPPSTPLAVQASKYPFASLRKSLRLLIDDNPEAMDEVENDISFVYSGYAPISVRLVQCVAQKGGVLSNPAEKEKAAIASNGSKNNAQVGGKVQAHPIVGWKGFEDILATIPGKIVDEVQNPVGVATPLGGIARPKDKAMTTVVFFLGGCTYTEIAALRWVARQHRGRNFLIATTGIITGSSIVDEIAGIQKTMAGPKDAGI
ncbi:Sec1-like protein [Lentinula raphanica]|nr:Sec1-like protein [Lentinula raphanica]